MSVLDDIPFKMLNLTRSVSSTWYSCPRLYAYHGYISSAIQIFVTGVSSSLPSLFSSDHIGFFFVSVLLIMRMYALYNRSILVLVCLVIISVVLFVVGTVSILLFCQFVFACLIQPVSCLMQFQFGLKNFSGLPWVGRESPCQTFWFILDVSSQ